MCKHARYSKRQAKRIKQKREHDSCLSVVEALRKPDLKDKQSNTHAVCTRMQDSVLWTKQERLCPKAHPAYLYSIPVSIISGIRHCSNLEISQVPTTSDKAVIDAILSCRCQTLNTPIGVHSLSDSPFHCSTDLPPSRYSRRGNDDCVQQAWELTVQMYGFTFTPTNVIDGFL